MRYGAEVGRFFIQRALCSDFNKVLCAKKGTQPGTQPGMQMQPGIARRRKRNSGVRNRNAWSAVGNADDADAHSVERLDLVFDPSKAAEREQGPDSIEKFQLEFLA